MYSLPPYAFLAQDFDTAFILTTNILQVSSCVWCFAHGAIFFIRDYDPEANKGNVLARMLEHKEAIISLKLGFFIFSHFRFICS
jgi:photosystem I P700 chlorophyll a apoprotein A2